MKRQTLKLQFSLGFFFGWMLSFAISGPILNIMSEIRNYSGLSPSLIFIFSHAAGLFLFGFIINKILDHRLLVLSMYFLCFILYIVFWFSNTSFWPMLLALIGLSAACAVLEWCRSYTYSIAIKDRVRFMASVIATAALANYLISFASSKLPISIVFYINILLLLFSVLLYMKPAAIDQKVADTAKVGTGLPASMLLIFCILVFGLNICGGLQYSIMYPFFSQNNGISLYYRQLPYLAVLGLMILVGHRVNKMLLVYLSVSFSGLSFIAFIFFSSAIKGQSVIGYIIIETLIQAAFGLFDVFVWTLLGDMSQLSENSSKVFGAGLCSNTLAIFIGELLGYVISKTYKDSLLITGLIAVTSILLTIIIIPFLDRLIKGHMKLELSEKLNVPEVKTSLPTLDISCLSNTGSLTARELEILGKILEGLPNKEIASSLCISENTLKTHVKHIYGKIGVANKRQLFMVYLGKIQ